VELNVDVLVAGSGAAGLVAALAAAERGARVLVVERGEAFGGTTALSGGRVWAPGNAHAAAAGIEDTAADAATYLRAVCPTAPAEHVDAFVATAPELVDWIERVTPHRFVLCPRYPDYHPSQPGATAGGRTLDSAPFDGLVEPVLRGPASAPVTHAEWESWRFAHRYDDRLLAERDAAGIVTGGRALVAGLLAGCRAAGVELEREARLTELCEGGARVGDRQIACRSVVLATGGFEWNSELRARHLAVTVVAFGSPPTNTGDAVALARAAGAELEALGSAWMMPMLQIPGEELGGRPFFRSLVTERGIPRSILVDAGGRRFASEALPYNELARAFPDERAWLVFDAGFRARYSLPGVRPDEPLPDWVHGGETLGDVARAAGIDPAGLERTAADWNAMCGTGRDELFARGESPYERYYGDPDANGNPTLGPLDEPPFHALAVLPGTIGTKGGPRTDPDGRALRPDGTPVRGLFAAGNAAAGWLADAYPAPGATLAVGMVTAYRAGRSA
jgi:succinate dehydrogenase/fumarate reductase flavoprotein subunit